MERLLPFPVSVHKIVFFYLRFLYSMFKTKKYLNNRKVAEAVNRFLSNSVDPLFYLSSFQNPFAETPGGCDDTGDFSVTDPFLPEMAGWIPGNFLTFPSFAV